MTQYIDKDALAAEIERLDELNIFLIQTDKYNEDYKCGYEHALEKVRDFLNTLEVKEVIAEQDCTCNEALNRIIGGSWNLLCPVNKLGLKTGDKVKVIIKAQKGEEV